MVNDNVIQLKLKTYQQAKLEALQQIIGRRDGTIRSLKTPWEKFNNVHIDGLEDKKIITIAGMSSTGKSLIVGQLEQELHDLNPTEDFAILDFNFEMTGAEIATRGVIAKTNISYKELQSANSKNLNEAKFHEVKKILETEETRKEIYYVEYPKTVEQYKQTCRRFYALNKKKFVTICDHSLLFEKSASDSNTTDMLYALGRASLELKKELPIIQIHLSQLNREIEDPKRRIPKSGLNYPDKSCLSGAKSVGSLFKISIL